MRNHSNLMRNIHSPLPRREGQGEGEKDFFDLFPLTHPLPLGERSFVTRSQGILRLTLIFILILIFSCGGGGENKPSRFLKPRWIASAQNPISIKGKSTKVVYVSNYLGGDIIPIDSERNKTIDTDLFNKEITPISVAGKLGQLFVRESASPDFSYDIFAASEEENAIYLIKGDALGSEEDEFLGHIIVDIGSTVVCTSAKPFFEDKGNSSNPSIGEIKMQVGITGSENWMVQYSEDDGAYLVQGSVSGIQTNLAYEDTPYSNDDGAISFTIYSGSREASNKDNFTFGTTCAKPLLLSGEPSSFILSNNKLFAAIRNLAKLSVYSEADFSFIIDINLNDGSLDQFEPNGIIEVGGKLYVSNGNGKTVAEVDPLTNTVDNYYDVSEKMSHLAYMSGNSNNIYLLPSNTNKLHVFSITSHLIENSVDLTDVPRGFIGISDGEDGVKRAMLTNFSNEVDVADLTNMAVIDQKTHSDQESFSTKAKFVDSLPKSSPKLVDISTADGLAKSERWLLTYDGVVPGTYSENGVISGSNLTDSLGEFDGFGVIPGDVVVINPFDASKEEVGILGVTDSKTLVLVAAPVNSGSGINYQIRSSNNYIVYGSVSGLQHTRLVEGTAYTTDSGSVSMNVIPSLEEPATEGDFFTFLTDDGIESIVLRNKMLPYHMTVVNRESDGREFVYVANEGSNNISVIDVLKAKESSFID